MYHFPEMTGNEGMCAEKMAYKATSQNLPNLVGRDYYFQLDTQRKKAHLPKIIPRIS